MVARRRSSSVGGSEVANTASNQMEMTAQSSEPVVIERTKKKGKNKKKKYSRAFGFGQKAEVALSKGGHRLANAVSDGLWSWRRERSRSARNKRDGAIRDAFKNYGRSMSKFGREAARIPEDITDAWPKLSKLFR